MDEAQMTAVLRDLYRCYRTARMNQLYYGSRLDRAQQVNRYMEIAVAVGSSSAIATWAIWKPATGAGAWALISAVATLLAVVKPFLHLTTEIERFTRLFAGHGDVYFDLERVVAEITQTHSVNPELVITFRAALDRVRKLGADDDPKPNERLLKVCFEKVKKEIPVSGLWLPVLRRN